MSNYSIEGLEMMISYIENKISRYEKIPNMHQIISIYRALICDIKIDIRRLEENAKTKAN